MKSNLQKELENILGCEISGDSLVRRCYSVDASFYKISPQVIVFPENEADIIRIVKFAKKNGVTVTARGAGTGLVGSALGRHIILDLKKMNAIKIGKNSVTVQPGAIKGVLDKMLSDRGMFFSPNPSVGKYCSMGGMIGTNASGSHALKYGSVIDNILKVTIIDGSGQKITLPDSREKSRKVLSIAKKIDRAKFPELAKNSCGYRLDSVQKAADSHRIIAGSEGTLGIVTSAEFKIRRIPKSKSLTVITYDNTDDIHNDVNEITKLNPSALEFLDEHTISNIDYRFSKGVVASLFVEIDEKIPSRSRQIRKLAKGTVEFSTTDGEKIQRWWRYRNSALAYSIRTIAKNSLTPHIIEDSAVPLKSLKKIFEITYTINKRFKTQTIIYGHAGNGNLHVRLIARRHSKKTLKSTARIFFEEVMKLGGTITAEHGDGIARSEFVKKQYGLKNYMAFKELKRAFDPKGILNPGKIIVDGSKMVQNLEY